jgi:AcrR family transcriptional regulator
MPGTQGTIHTTTPGAGSANGEAGGRRERTRRRLLSAAFALLGSERGRSVRIEEICGGAGVSRATFYNYFSSTDELYAALSFDLSHEFNIAVHATMARMQDTAERASAGMRYYLDRAREDPQWGWAMVHISASGPLFGAETAASALATVEEGIASGEFRLEDARIGRDIILGTALAAMITQLRENLSERHARAVARHVLVGLGVSEERARVIADHPLPDPCIAMRESGSVPARG